jgi:dolichol-phosphate mannosyltransferase
MPEGGDGAPTVGDPVYSFVIPLLDEVGTVPALCERLHEVLAQLDGPAEVVFVDDGSTDGTFDLLVDQHRRDARFKVVRLSRNFGHQLAITAGLDHARGQAVVIMDGDLQDPPEVALAMAERWRDGCDVVYAVRDEREGESRFKVATASAFYRLMGRMSDVAMPPDAGDFRLVSRRALDAVLAMPEHQRYLRGMFAWVGYDQAGVHYVRDARHAGTTKFSLRKMLRFASDGIASFSAAPLRLVLRVGFLVSLLSVLVGVVTIGLKIGGYEIVPGWASLAVGLTFITGVQLTVLGVTGEYVARIYEEVKRRPLYLTRDEVGFDPSRRRGGSGDGG